MIARGRIGRSPNSRETTCREGTGKPRQNDNAFRCFLVEARFFLVLAKNPSRSKGDLIAAPKALDFRKAPRTGGTLRALSSWCPHCAIAVVQVRLIGFTNTKGTWIKVQPKQLHRVSYFLISSSCSMCLLIF